MSLLDELRKGILNRLEENNVTGSDDLASLMKNGQWGQILYVIDTKFRDYISFESSEILKGLFNRFPMVPLFSGNQESIAFSPVGSMARLVKFKDFVLGFSSLYMWHRSRTQEWRVQFLPLENFC